MKSATTFFNNGKCCLPDQGNVWHHAKKFTKTGFDPFIKYLTEPIFTDFSCCEGIPCLNSDVNDSRDRCALFIGHLLNMVGSSGKKLIWKQHSFLHEEWTKVSRNVFWRFWMEIGGFWSKQWLFLYKLTQKSVCL